MTRDELEGIITLFMDTHTAMTLACSRDDQPWAATVYYARSGFDLVFFSSGNSRHVGTFKTNPCAAASIHGEYRTWRDIKGLQLEGTVAAINGFLNITAAVRTYTAKFPFAKDFLSDPAALIGATGKRLSRTAVHAFHPDKIFYLDNSLGFGARWKLELVDGTPTGEPEPV